MKDIQLFHDSCFAMNTSFDIVCYSIEDKIFKQVFNEIQKELQSLENLLSCYSEKSELFNLNKKAYSQAVNVSSELFNVLLKCKELSLKSYGYFDITLKPIVNYWKNSQIKHIENKDFLRLINNLGVDKIIFNENDKSIAFENKDLEIDLGGIGKGYALVKIEKKIQEYNMENVFISFGNSSVITKGKHPYGDFWPFGICDIFNTEKIIHSFQLNNHSVSTSASFQNIKGQNIYHIVNPVNGELITTNKLISVKAPSPFISEMLSTALLVSDSEYHETIISSFDANEIIEVCYDNDFTPKVKRLL